MSAAVADFNTEVGTKLKEKHGDSVGNEFMGIYHRLNGGPFKNFAWLKELNFVKMRQEGDSEEQKKRNLEAIVAGLELFKDLKCYGKIYQHYKKELEGGAVPDVVQIMMPQKPPVIVVESEVKSEPVVEKKRVTRKKKVPQNEVVLPDTVTDICGTEVKVDKKYVKRASKKKEQDFSSEKDQSSLSSSEGKKALVVKYNPKMTDKQKQALIEKVRQMLYPSNTI